MTSFSLSGSASENASSRTRDREDVKVPVDIKLFVSGTRLDNI